MPTFVGYPGGVMHIQFGIFPPNELSEESGRGILCQVCYLELRVKSKDADANI